MSPDATLIVRVREMAESLISSLGVPIAVAVITALLSVQLAIRRFRAERWWERKAQAYASLLSALFHVQRSLRAEVRRLEEGAQLSESYQKDLSERAREGYVEIRRSAVLGTFLLNDDAAVQLDQLIAQLDDPAYNLDALEEVYGNLNAVTKTMDALKPIAKADLSVRR